MQVKRIGEIALAAGLALAAPAGVAAQQAVVVECTVGDEVLESAFDPGTAVGPEGRKVLPLHMVLTRPGEFAIEFRSQYPFTLYAYRYDTGSSRWQFLEASATSRPATDQSGESFQYWDTSISKGDATTVDYLFQLEPGTTGQRVNHQITHVRRTRSCG